MSDQLEPETQGSKPPPGAPPPTAPPPSDDAPPPSSQVDDADDLRKFHLNCLFGKRLTQILIVTAVTVAALAGLLAASPAVALIAAGGILPLSVIIVFFLADSASEDAFFDIYAQQRGMTRTGGDSLPPVTPLLRKGDEREAGEVLRGSLADRVEGTLALYTYTEVHHDKNGRHETDYHFTVSMVDLPECVEIVRGLLEPDRTPGGTRLYSPADIERLQRIGELLAQGLNLAGIDKVLVLEEEVRRLTLARVTTRPATTTTSPPRKARRPPGR